MGRARKSRRRRAASFARKVLKINGMGIMLKSVTLAESSSEWRFRFGALV